MSNKNSIARKLRDAGKPELAARLIEAFKLDKKIGSDPLEIERDQGLATVDDDEVTNNSDQLEQFIPASALVRRRS